MKTIAERTRELHPSVPSAILGSLWPLVAGIALALALQFLLAPVLGSFAAKMLLDIGIAIVLAASLNIVNGFAGQFSIGHAGFMMVGGYASAIVTYYGSIKLWGSPDVHGGFLGVGDLLFLGSCVVGGIVAAVAGLVVGLPSLRLRGDYLAIVTLGFGEIMRVIVQRSDDVLYPDQVAGKSMLEVADNLGGSLGFSVPTYVSPTPWKEETGHAGIFFAYLVVAIVLICAYRLKLSSKGRALLAVRENEIAAEAMGVNTAQVKVMAFVVAAFFAGVGGVLFTHVFGNTLNPRELGFQKSIDIVIMVVLGGMGSISGAVVAAIGLTIMPELLREFAEYRMIFYALALILVMILRPQGLFGIKEIWEISWRQELRDFVEWKRRRRSLVRRLLDSLKNEPPAPPAGPTGGAAGSSSGSDSPGGAS
jgi:branched-chain amino acid transport system permease protein